MGRPRSSRHRCSWLLSVGLWQGVQWDSGTAWLRASFKPEPGASWPSVSIQVITYNRPQWLAQALRQISAQDYLGRTEVLVVDDSPESAQEIVQEHSGALDVRYIHLTGRRYTIGEKRNLAVAESTGDFVGIWDDDDIFPVDRIRQQVSRIIARGSDCSSIQVAFVYSTVDGELRKCTGLPLPFENSFMLRRQWLQTRPQFENSSLGEGIVLFQGLQNWYAEAEPIPGSELPFIYVRTRTSTAPDDALEPCPMDTLLLRSAEGGLDVDLQSMALVRGLRRFRFPERSLRGTCGGRILDEVRGAVRKVLLKDLEVIEAVGSRGSLAAAYFAAAGGSLKAGSFDYGPAGEAPDGSTLEELAPPPLPPPGRASPDAAVPEERRDWLEEEEALSKLKELRWTGRVSREWAMFAAES